MRGRLGAHKDNHPVEGLDLEDPGQGIELMQTTHQPEALADGRGRGGAPADLNLVRVLQMAACDALDRGRHGCRKKRDLTFGRGLLQHPFNIIDKAHAQHLVRLVEHERTQRFEFERAFAHVVHNPARGPNYDLRATFERLDLRNIGLPAVQRQHMEPPLLASIALEGLGNLNRELAGWCKHQHLHVFGTGL